MAKKAYYYTAHVFPVADPANPFEYFKAFSKKQIKKHLNNINKDAINIYDPSAKPVHGIYYEDVTEVFV
jgi:hypothetical protein